MSSGVKSSSGNSKWRIVPKFLNETEERLIKACAAKTQARPDSLSLSELGRVGFSGARLLLCQFGGRGIPFVIKIAKEKNIEEEHKAITRVCTYFRDAGTPSPEPAFDSGFGALIYWHQGGITNTEIESSKELREIVFGPHARKWPDNALTAIFRKLYSHLQAAQNAKSQAEFCFYDEYRKYLRSKRGGEECLRGILGRHCDTDRFRFLGARILNPTKFVKSAFFMRKQHGGFCPIHGDLHANNVIIHSDQSVKLIDFAWAHDRRHALKDHVLMECSLRFMLFPHHVDMDEQLTVDRLLLNPDGAGSLAVWSTGTHLARSYARLGKVLEVIRENARVALLGQKDWFQQYLSAQFLVLYGLMGFGDYNRFIAVRALGMIAQRLRELDS